MKKTSRDNEWKVRTWNVNGLRSIAGKGLLPSLLQGNPDLVFMQETRCLIDDVPRLELLEHGYCLALAPAEEKGYAGVGVLYKERETVHFETPVWRQSGITGRVQLVRCPAGLFVNVYAPHGHRDQRNMELKMCFFDELIEMLVKIGHEHPIILGDLNIAHGSIDLSRPMQNLRNTMFTEAERARIDQILAMGYVDVFRFLNPAEPGYTWWPWIASARERNVGWRIDYILAHGASQLMPFQCRTVVDQAGSDHCPVEAIFKSGI